MADGKKLFSWPEVLVLMDCREDSLKKFVSGMGGLDSTPQSPWSVQVLEWWQIAAHHLISRAMICCSLPLSLAVEEAYQMVTEKVRMESMMAYKGTIILFGRLTSSTGLLWWESWCSASTLDPGKWWFPGSSRTSLCWWWSHPWWWWVWLCSFWRPQSSPPF